MLKRPRQIVNRGIRFGRGATGPYARKLSGQIQARSVNKFLGVPELDFSNIGEWSLVPGDTSTITQETQQVRHGTASMRFTSPANSTAADAVKNVNWDMSNSNGVWVSFYLEEGQNTGITLYLAHQENMGGALGRWFVTFISQSFERAGWNMRFIPRDNFSVLDGTPDWANPILSIRVRISSTTSEQRITIMDALWID